MAKNPDAHMERNSRKLMRLLEKDGWKIVRVKGSHHTLKKPNVKHPIVLVHPKKDLPIGLVRQIYKDVGWRT
jgi:predicted RNA binding protein YcfA (HicA-like mRNA interferase family)